MTRPPGTLVCWHSDRAGAEVLQCAVASLRARRVRIDKVLYLLQKRRHEDVSVSVPGVTVEKLPLALEDPTHHESVYRAVKDHVCPRLSGTVHVNVSPGTPAMHAVWLVLLAGGRLPSSAQLWSSQRNPETGQVRIDPVEFPVTTYLAEVSRIARARPDDAVYEIDARSAARRDALERLARFARVPGAPLLVLGERGTGKTRVVETHVAALKRRAKVVTLACGGLDSALAESALFGHEKGAFTGAAADRRGLIAEAHGGILFLDEIQDLPRPAQRMLVRVLQDRRHRYRPVGSDHETEADVDLVCASNLTAAKLRERLDLDLYDRISLLTVELPALRQCREDLVDDWGRVWRELRRGDELPVEAPWSDEIEHALSRSELAGNLRDLQRMASLVSAWWLGNPPVVALRHAVEEWTRGEAVPHAEEGFGAGTRRDRVLWFTARMARWARGRWGTWSAAAAALGCDEKTLREDASAGSDPMQTTELHRGRAARRQGTVGERTS